MTETYFTIEKQSVAEFRDRGSRFIAYAIPIINKEDFKTRMAELKKEHAKASHHCFAYRLGTDGNDFRVSDAGEPSGSAGRPIMGQIDSRHLTNVMVVVVRYFGGTLLGVPGLINAYKTSASMALDATSIIQKPILVPLGFEFDYTRMNDVMRLIRQYDCSVLHQDLQLFCRMEIGIPVKQMDHVKLALLNIQGVKMQE